MEKIYILTFFIVVGSAELKREVVIYDREKAVLFHDRKNFAEPNSCQIDSLIIKKIKKNEKYGNQRRSASKN